MEDWQILALKIDKDPSSEELADFFGRLWPNITKTGEISCGLRAKGALKKNIKKIAKRMDSEKSILSIYGNGRYHHYTYGLCHEIADARSKEYGYIHIDHHKDDYFRRDKIINCGSFVCDLFNDSNAAAVRFIGCGYENEEEAIREKKLRRIGVRKGVKNLIKKIPEDVYISMDFDCMNRTEIITDYQGGDLRLEELLKSLSAIQENKNIISADMLGYRGGKDSKSLLFYAIVAGKIIGKDTEQFETFYKKAKNGKFTYENLQAQLYDI